MNRVEALGRLLRPKTVAIIGGDSAAEVVRQCRAIGFEGDIFTVNPTRAELGGIPCVARVADLPAVPDASFIAAPPQATLDIVRKLAAMNAPGAICFASGFAETGDAGAELQEALRRAAGDMAVIGPNCHGYLNYLDGVALWPDEHGGTKSERGVAVISQSGNIAINLTMQQRGVDFSYVVSIGNCGVLGLHDYVEALLEDERVSAIGLLVEGIDDIPAFSRAAIKALERGVPLVAFKNGRSARGAAISRSHTGALAGSTQLYKALFARLGVARCDTLTQFLETMKFLSIVGVLPGTSVGSLSCSGGDAAMVADNAALLGLDLPQLSDASAERLQALLGPNVAVTNPLDYHLYIWGDFEKLRACFCCVLENRYACTLLVLDYPSGKGNDVASWRVAEQALIAAMAETGERGVIVSSLPETMPAEMRDRLKHSGIAPMQGIEDCLFAIRAAAAMGAARSNVAGIEPVSVPPAPAGEIEPLDEWQGKQALAAAGVDVPTGAICSAPDAAAVAASIGYPIVVKALTAELSHKSEAGAVAVGVQGEAALAATLQSMTPRFERFLIEKMIGPVVAEMIVGVSRDATFGLTLLIGSGGTRVELIADTVSLLLPARRADIDAAIRTLKVDALLGGYRGAPAADRGAVLDAVESIVSFAEGEADTLQELDVNPLLVTPDAAIAADVYIRKAASRP